MEESYWLLKLVIPKPNEPPWVVYSTTNLDLVVRANDEDEARKLADEHTPVFEMPDTKVWHPFLSKERSTCWRVK